MRLKLIFGFIIYLVINVQGELLNAAFSVRVIDENGNPVSNAIVGVAFYRSKGLGEGAGEDINQNLEKPTDADGMCSFEGECNGSISWDINKEGFYRTYGPKIKFTNSALGQLQPWNKLYEGQLRKIENPVPMYARRLENCWPKVKVPEFGKAIGYDLMKSDWLMPYGKGEVADFLVRMDQTLLGMRDDGYQMHDTLLTLSFPNGGDGIQVFYSQPNSGSVFRLPRSAPVDGYQSNLVKRSYLHEDATMQEVRDDDNYFFRVRTEKGEQGQIISALYGKIQGPIRFGREGQIEFTYYLNPTPNDRNMEYDPQRNLLTNLPPTEGVYEP